MTSLCYHPDDSAAEQVAAHLEFAAMCAGWADAASLAVARTELDGFAWKVIEWRKACDPVPLATYADLWLWIEDRMEHGALTLSVVCAYPRSLSGEVRDAARRVFDRWQKQEKYSVGAWLEMATTDGSEDDEHPLGARVAA